MLKKDMIEIETKDQTKVKDSTVNLYKDSINKEIYPIVTLVQHFINGKLIIDIPMKLIKKNPYDIQIQKDYIFPSIKCNRCNLFINENTTIIKQLIYHYQYCLNIKAKLIILPTNRTINNYLGWRTKLWSQQRLEALIKDKQLIESPLLINEISLNEDLNPINCQMILRGDNNSPSSFLKFLLSTFEAKALPKVLTKVRPIKQLKELLSPALIVEKGSDKTIDKVFEKWYEGALLAKQEIEKGEFEITEKQSISVYREIETLIDLLPNVACGSIQSKTVIASLIQGSLGKLPSVDPSRCLKKLRVQDNIYSDAYAGDNYCFQILKDSDLFDATFPFATLALRDAPELLIDFLSSIWILYTNQECGTMYQNTFPKHYYAGWVATNHCYEQLKHTPLSSQLLWEPQVFAILMRKWVGGRSVELSKNLIEPQAAASLRASIAGGHGAACAVLYLNPELFSIDHINAVGILATLSHDVWQEVDDVITMDGLNEASIVRYFNLCPVAVFVDAITGGYFPDPIIYLILGWAIGTLASPRYITGLVPPLIASKQVKNPAQKATYLLCNAQLQPNQYSGISPCPIHNISEPNDLIVNGCIDSLKVRKAIANYCKNYTKPGKNCSCVYSIIYQWLNTSTKFVDELPPPKEYRF